MFVTNRRFLSVAVLAAVALFLPARHAWAQG
jgi:hypothetical protein